MRQHVATTYVSCFDTTSLDESPFVHLILHGIPAPMRWASIELLA